MKRTLAFFLCVLTVVGLGGCLQIERTIKLNADGSGTVEETMVMSKMMIEQIKNMGAQFRQGGAGAKPEKEFSLLDEAQLKKEASQMGEGVTFVGAKKISTATGEGYTATFAFKDINQLQLDQNPSNATPKIGAVATPQKKENIGFQYAKGDLTITMPPQKFEGKNKEKQKKDPAAMAGAQPFFKDMKIMIAVEVPGKIVATNASYHDASRVTLMEMDFNKLLADPAKLQQFLENEPESLEEAKKLLKEIPGIKIETNQKVNVKF